VTRGHGRTSANPLSRGVGASSPSATSLIPSGTVGRRAAVCARRARRGSLALPCLRQRRTQRSERTQSCSPSQACGSAPAASAAFSASLARRATWQGVRRMALCITLRALAGQGSVSRDGAGLQLSRRRRATAVEAAQGYSRAAGPARVRLDSSRAHRVTYVDHCVVAPYH
jgi:hypothetical protein